MGTWLKQLLASANLYIGTVVGKTLSQYYVRPCVVLYTAQASGLRASFYPKWYTLLAPVCRCELVLSLRSSMPARGCSSFQSSWFKGAVVNRLGYLVLTVIVCSLLLLAKKCCIRLLYTEAGSPWRLAAPLRSAHNHAHMHYFCETDFWFKRAVSEIRHVMNNLRSLQVCKHIHRCIEQLPGIRAHYKKTRASGMRE